MNLVPSLLPTPPPSLYVCLIFVCNMLSMYSEVTGTRETTDFCQFLAIPVIYKIGATYHYTPTKRDSTDVTKRILFH